MTRIIEKKGYREIHLQIVPENDETAGDFALRAKKTVNDYNAEIIRATVFGELNGNGLAIRQFEDHFPGFEFPLSWIESDNCNGSFINGLYIFAVSDIEVKRVYGTEMCVGSFFHTDDAEYCYLGGLYSDPLFSPGKQTEAILNAAEHYLNLAGLSFENTIRTWYYLDDILGWYGDFNKARTTFFNKHGIFDKLVPASTGIGGRNPRGSNVCLELNAIKPRNGAFKIERVSSPLQCPAETYGSSFSRAITYTDNTHSYLTVSGTASLDQDGEVIHKDDIGRQIERTFDVVNKILESRGFEYKDAIRAYAYFEDIKHAGAFGDYLRTSGLDGKISFLCSRNKVCWDNLLFEIELDAVKPLA